MNKIKNYFKVLCLALFIFAGVQVNALDFPSGWSSAKNPLNNGFVKMKDRNIDTDYQFTPLRNGRKGLGTFSYVNVGGYGSRKAAGDMRTNSIASLKTFMNTYISTSGQPESYAQADARYEFNLKSAGAVAKGKAGVRFKNIGFYDNKVIDMEMIIKDFKGSTRSNLKHKTFGVYINKNFGIGAWNMEWVSVDYNFYVAGTNTKISPKGFWQYVDIDGGQSITTNKNSIKGQKWVGNNNVLKMATSGNNIHIFEPSDTNYTGTASTNKASLGYEFQASTLNQVYRNNRFISDENITQSLVFFGYDSNVKPEFPPLKNEPEKWIVKDGDFGGDATEVTKALNNLVKNNKYETNDLVKDNEKQKEFKYAIQQDVGFRSSNTVQYNTFEITDKLMPLWKTDLDKIKIYSISQGKLVNNWFNISIDEATNTLKVEAKPATLKLDAFYGTPIFIQVSVNLDKDIKLDDLKDYQDPTDKQKYVFKNTAISTIDGNDKPTNEVEITGDVQPEPYLEKTTEKKALKVGDVFTYKIKVGNKENTGEWFNAKLSDELPDYLEYQKGTTKVDSEVVEDENAIWTNEEKPFDVDGNGTIEANETAKLDVLNRALGDVEAGKEFVVEFNVKVTKAPLTETDLGTPLVINKATATGDNGTPPPSEVETPIVPDPEITKKNDSKFVKKGDVFDYTIKVRNKEQSGTWLDVVMSDKLKDYLEYQAETTQVSQITSKSEEEAKNTYYKVTDEEDADNTMWSGKKLKVNVGNLKANEYMLITFKVKLIKDVKIVENTAEAIGGSEFPPETPIPGVDTPIEDTVVNKLLKISKRDMVGSDELPGAHFEMHEGSELTKETLLTEFVSTDKPTYMYVVPGTYYFKEVLAPQGYYETTIVFKRVINDDGKIEEPLIIYNEAIPMPETSLNSDATILDTIKSILY